MKYYKGLYQVAMAKIHEVETEEDFSLNIIVDLKKYYLLVIFGLEM